jgi:hypothetical protein
MGDNKEIWDPYHVRLITAMSYLLPFWFAESSYSGLSPSGQGDDTLFPGMSWSRKMNSPVLILEDGITSQSKQNNRVGCRFRSLRNHYVPQSKQVT